MNSDLTKAAEIARFTALTKQFPPSSYLGHWLRSVTATVQHDITNDIFPTVLPAEAHERAALIIKQGEDDATRIKERATREAAQIVNTAKEEAASIARRSANQQRAAYEAARAFLSALNS